MVTLKCKVCGAVFEAEEKDTAVCPICGVEGEYLEEVEAEKADVNTARARIVVNNPSGVELTGVKIEYANVQVISNVFDNGKNCNNRFK